MCKTSEMGQDAHPTKTSCNSLGLAHLWHKNIPYDWKSIRPNYKSLCVNLTRQKTSVAAGQLFSFLMIYQPRALTCERKQRWLLTFQVTSYCCLSLYDSATIDDVLWPCVYLRRAVGFILHQLAVVVVVTSENCQTIDVNVMFVGRHNGEEQAYPSKHEKLSQCCFNVGPASQTMGQH